MIAVITRSFIFTGAVLLLLEVSLRIFYFGLDGLIPARLNSYTVILDSGLVQTADNTDIYYELKPNLDTIFSGQPFVTNSKGLADNEYPLEKPANTYRIAVTGSSWSMATGVTLAESYQALLEQRLQQELPDSNAEVINFAVEYYGLSEITATTRQKIMPYDPDMIIVGITAVTPAIKWDENKPPYTPKGITPPFWQSYLYSTIMNLAGKQAYTKSKRDEVFRLGGGYAINITRSLQEIAELTTGKDIDVAILWLSHGKTNENMLEHVQITTQQHGFTFIPLHLDTLAAQNNITSHFLTPGYGRHPSAIGHQLIADEIYQQLWANKAINQPADKQDN